MGTPARGHASWTVESRIVLRYEDGWHHEGAVAEIKTQVRTRLLEVLLNSVSVAARTSWAASLRALARILSPSS